MARKYNKIIIGVITLFLLGIGYWILAKPDPANEQEIEQAQTDTPDTPVIIPTQQAPTNLGISRNDVQGFYELSGFVFSSGNPVNGIPQVIGQSSNGLAIAQLIGEPDNLIESSVTVIIDPNNSDAGFDNLLALFSLPIIVTPHWTTSGAWLDDNIGQLVDGAIDKAETTHENARIILVYNANLDAISLSITVQN